MNEELLRCPFCGGEPSYGQSLSGSQRWMDHIECLNCGCMSHSFYTMDEAKDAWNKRTLPSSTNK